MTWLGNAGAVQMRKVTRLACALIVVPGVHSVIAQAPPAVFLEPSDVLSDPLSLHARRYDHTADGAAGRLPVGADDRRAQGGRSDAAAGARGDCRRRRRAACAIRRSTSTSRNSTSRTSPWSARSGTPAASSCAAARPCSTQSPWLADSSPAPSTRRSCCCGRSIDQCARPPRLLDVKQMMTAKAPPATSPCGRRHAGRAAEHRSARSSGSSSG